MRTLIIWYAIEHGNYKDVIRFSGISHEEAVSRWLADQVRDYQYKYIEVHDVCEISKESHQSWDSTGITMEFNSKETLGTS
tara:strand:- start:269 stop:511 length:243 start_codon:yes stop_codon:yes gene_type:complete